MVERTLERWVHEYEYDPEFITEGFSTDVIDQVIEILRSSQHSQAWLAQQMGVSPQHVSRLFNAAPNLSARSIGRLAAALHVKPKILLDSEVYLIVPADQPLDIEVLRTDQAISQAQRRRFVDAQSATPVEVGGTGAYLNAAS